MSALRILFPFSYPIAQPARGLIPAAHRFGTATRQLRSRKGAGELAASPAPTVDVVPKRGFPTFRVHLRRTTKSPRSGGFLLQRSNDARGMRCTSLAMFRFSSDSSAVPCRLC